MSEAAREQQLAGPRPVVLSSLPRIRSASVPILGILVGLLIGGLLIALAKADPIEIYLTMLRGAFGGGRQITSTLLKACPLLLMGLGLTVAFRAKIWNIGGEGQYFIGALFGAVVGLSFPHWPRLLLVPTMLLAACLGGALWALIPATFRIRYGMSEIISTLMLNYVALFLIAYIARGPLQDPISVYPESARLDASTRLPLLFGSRIHLGVLLAILLAPAVYVLLWRTPLGFHLRAVGSKPSVARYAGIQVERAIVFVMIFSGAFAGLTGIIEVITLHGRLKGTIVGGYGFSGILVALLGRMNPFGVALASLVFAALIIGSEAIHVVAGLPPALAEAIQAIIVLSMLTVDAVTRRRVS